MGSHPSPLTSCQPGFQAATPLLDLPARAAAAYLGTFLISLLKGLEFQHAVGIFDDVMSRAHTLTCLELPDFWERVITWFGACASATRSGGTSHRQLR